MFISTKTDAACSFSDALANPALAELPRAYE